MSEETRRAPRTARRPRHQGRICAPDEMLRRRTAPRIPGALIADGDAIRRARLAKGLTQEAFGRRLKLSQAAVWQLEANRYFINETMARHLAEVLCSEPLSERPSRIEIVSVAARAAEHWRRFVVDEAASEVA